MWKFPAAADKRAQGAHYEKLACRYLKRHGLKLIKQNANYRQGEIDLIMQDQSHLVFIEVRFRKSQSYGGALASVDAHKQKKLTTAAQIYLQTEYGNQPPFCRFDVVAIQLNAQKEPEIQWVKNAF